MAWTETCAVNERYRFVERYFLGEETMTDLCLDFGVSRKTGYKWVDRYVQEGVLGLQDRSRRPQSSPRRPDEAVVDAVLDLRRRRPRWGPVKLKAWLERHHPDVTWPAASTMGVYLKAAKLSRSRKRRRRTPPYTRPFQTCFAPNDVWCLDFKGWFRTQDGTRCDPFTMTDGFSRYVLVCDHVARPNEAHVARLMERAFKDYGLPRAIRSDNGAPFASRAPAGLSRLSIWWLKLGIEPERIEPGKPQQNGRHERFHLTLKQETASPPASSLKAQQKRFRRFRDQFNEDRPHEALGLKVPSDIYTRSKRSWPGTIEEPHYASDMAIRRVRSTGEIKWKADLVYVSQALSGERVGVQEHEKGYNVFFMHVFLGRIDNKTGKLMTNIKHP